MVAIILVCSVQSSGWPSWLFVGNVVLRFDFGRRTVRADNENVVDISVAIVGLL